METFESIVSLMVFQHDLRRASYRVFNVRSYYMRANNKVINLSMPLPDMMVSYKTYINYLGKKSLRFIA